jgi:hypothetical protein
LRRQFVLAKAFVTYGFLSRLIDQSIPWFGNRKQSKTAFANLYKQPDMQSAGDKSSSAAMAAANIRPFGSSEKSLFVVVRQTKDHHAKIFVSAVSGLLVPPQTKAIRPSSNRSLSRRTLPFRSGAVFHAKAILDGRELVTLLSHGD